MWAICIGDDEDRSLVWQQVQRPVVGPGQVLVRVFATALNRADLLQRRGLYPPPAGASEVMGLEMAGVIAELGPGVTRWKRGDRVCALLEGGGYAQYALVDEGMLLPVPDGLSLAQAAALPEALFTAFLNLVVEAEMQTGESVLVHAGASGVGAIAVQMCKALGNPVYATTSTTKMDFVREQGATEVWDRLEPRFLQTLEESLSRVDIILDAIGGAYLETNIQLLGSRGRLVLIGLLGGRKGTLNLGRVLMSRLRLIGSTLRNRGRREKVRLTERIRKEIWPLVLQGEIQPNLFAIHPIQKAEEAHALMASNQTRGKVVLEIFSEADF
jgi:NADPH2:quinone reductase